MSAGTLKPRVVSEEVSRTKRNVQRLLAALNNLHNSEPLGRQNGQGNPLLADLPIGGASQSTSMASDRPIDRLINNALPQLTGRNPSQPSFLGQNAGPYLQPQRVAVGASQNTGEQPQRTLSEGRRPLDGLVNAARYYFNTSRPSMFGQNGGRNLQRLRGSLRNSQNTGVPLRGIFGGRPMDRLANPALSRTSILGQNGYRTHQHMGGSTENLQNFGRFNGATSSIDNPGQDGSASGSTNHSGYSASDESGDLSRSGLDESASSGDNSS